MQKIQAGHLDGSVILDGSVGSSWRADGEERPLPHPLLASLPSAAAGTAPFLVHPSGPAESLLRLLLRSAGSVFILTDGTPDADAGAGLAVAAGFDRFGSDLNAAPVEASIGRFMAGGSKGFANDADGPNFLPLGC